MARERWPSRLLFIFAAVGSAAGLGNLWRFPYLTYKYGGGAFLIPYLIALLVLGIPLLVLEFAVGQHFQRSTVGAMRKLKTWAGAVGWWMLGIAFVVLSYYAAVMAWSLRYFFSSFSMAWSGGAESYFYEQVLGLSSGIGVLGGINWILLACLIGVWILIYFSVFKGIKSVSQVVKVTMPLPILLIFILLIRAVTLEGAAGGLVVYMKPVFSALLDPEIWVAAASQIFFTLSVGLGIMIAYASYVKKKQDTAGDALWTALMNSGISLLAGFVVFGTLGFLAMQKGVAVPDVVASGPGLAFVVFPEALSMMPMAWLFSLLFFIVLLSLGIDSAFSLLEGVLAAFKDRLRTSTMKLSLIGCILGFAGGIIFVTGAGLYFLDIVDHFVLSYGLIMFGIFECLLVGWTKAGKEVKEHLARESPWFPVNLWWWLIRLVIPIILVVMFITFFLKELAAPYEGYPGWAIAVGWAAVFLPLVVGFFLNKWYGKKREVAEITVP
ncbi:sodium-dependent transporter [Candidatus Woesearchaeota archaeon]|nr:sodium-dependent transporter [Candidatus Woesearchaeota archaeon]